MSSKYRNRRAFFEGIWFDSRKEAARYRDLLLLERAGLIRNLELQPRFDLVVNGQKVGTYIADFRYTDVTTGEPVVEDCKGFKTPVYKLKKKLMKAIHGIDIVET